MLTNKGKYGLKALVHLARLPPGETAQSLQIAQAEAIPKKFLDAILGDLRNAGIVVTRKGKYGGYRLALPPAEIMAGSAIRALDGPLAPIGCASRTRFRPCDDCADVESCTVRLLMTEVRDLSAKLLDGTSIAEMQRLSERSREDLTYQI